jgi:hypothetical protein
MNLIKKIKKTTKIPKKNPDTIKNNIYLEKNLYATINFSMVEIFIYS